MYFINCERGFFQARWPYVEFSRDVRLAAPFPTYEEAEAKALELLYHDVFEGHWCILNNSVQIS